MPLENAQFISGLNPLWPLGTDGVNTSDDHHRNTKLATQQSFPNIDAVVNATPDDLNLLAGAAVDGSGLAPVGTVISGFWTSAPDGYIACDGVAINPIYTDLIALIGADTPDLRGQFLRGWSVDAAVDPDGPRAALEAQADDFESHTHPVNGLAEVDPAGDTEGGSGDPRPKALNIVSGATGGDETRPVNVAVFFAVKW